MPDSIKSFKCADSKIKHLHGRTVKSMNSFILQGVLGSNLTGTSIFFSFFFLVSLSYLLKVLVYILLQALRFT